MKRLFLLSIFMFTIMFAKAQVVISEIMYNTPSYDDEWVEICNMSNADLDISGYYLNDFTFPTGTTITAGDCLVVSFGSDGDGDYNNGTGCSFTPDFGIAADVYDTNALTNSSGTITLKNASGIEIDSVSYDDGHDSSTDGRGSSYQLVNATIDNSSTASNWVAVAQGGSPGSMATTPTCPSSEPVDTVCSITDLSATAACSGDDAYVTVTYTVANGSTQEYSIDGGSNYMALASGDVITVTGPTTEETKTIMVRDVDNAACTSIIDVVVPTCPTTEKSLTITEFVYDVCNDSSLAEGIGEYVIIQNSGLTTINLSGTELDDDGDFTNADGQMLPNIDLEAGQHIIVAGTNQVSWEKEYGAVPTGYLFFQADNWQVLNNVGDSVGVTNGTNNTTYPDSATNGQAMVWNGTAFEPQDKSLTCSPVTTCTITNLAVSAVCDGNDAVTTVTYETNGSTAQEVSVDGVNFYTVNSGDEVRLTGPTASRVGTVIVRDQNDANCKAMVDFTFPACPDVGTVCAIGNVATTAACNGDDAYVTVTYTVANGSTQEYSIDGGATYIALVSGDVITFTNVTEGETKTIMLRDVDNADCTATVDVVLCEPCAITNLAVSAVCEGEEVKATITFDASNVKSAQVSVNGGFRFYPVASGQAITIPGDLIPTTGTAIVRDAFNTNCKAEVSFNIPPCPTPIPIVVISEIMANPSTLIDSNRDGAIHASEDEYIELANTTDSSIDVSGWTLSDKISVRHVFAEGTVIEAGEFLTVFGGGTINKIFADDAVVASSGMLGLNNSGDDITLTQVLPALANVTGRVINTVIDSQTYQNAPSGESLALDINGDFVLQSTLNGAKESINVFNTFAPLPVDFISVKVEDKGDYRLLSWSTATEINNDRFEIEVSENGVDYTKVGTVAGSGTTSKVSTYTFDDTSSISEIVAYYRIKQVDFDGQYSYSDVVTVTLQNGTISIYPNPVNTVLTVKGAGNFKVYDLLGREIETVINSNLMYQLNTASYEAGTYLIRFENGQTSKFTKM